MLLTEFQKIVVDNAKYQPTSKEKFKGYYYNVFSVTNEVIQLEYVLTHSFTNTTAIIKKIAEVVASALALLKELNFPINTEEFALDDFKNNLKAYQPTVKDYQYYTISMIFSLGKLHSVLSLSFGEKKQELANTDKMDMLNVIYDIIVKTLLLSDFLGFNNDIIFEQYSQQFQNKKEI